MSNSAKSTPDLSLPAFMQRRSFLQYSGATVGATALVLAGCSKDVVTPTQNTSISLGPGDLGVLNYIYALEQLEAAFYAQVHTDTPSTEFSTAQEADYFAQLAAHEAIHRDFLKVTINRDAPGRLLQNLTFDFKASIDFKTRSKVLEAAQTFEELGVAAYNGVAALIKTDVYLILAGQIVSVEARHAAYISSLQSAGTFAKSGNIMGGLDQSMSPTAVLAAMQPYIKEALDVSSIGQ